MPYKHTKFQVESRQGAGLVNKRNTNREKIAKIAKSRENRENYGKSLKKKARKLRGKLREIAKNRISAYLHISVSIDAKLPKLSWQIVLMMRYKHTKFQVETFQGARLVGKKVLKIPKKSGPQSQEIMSERGPGRSASEDRD